MKKRELKISDIVERCHLKVIAGRNLLNRPIKGGYASDLLSDVMANARANDIWVTLQGHPNIVAVAKLKDLAGIIIVNGRKPDKDTIAKADAESVAILTSGQAAFELIGVLYEAGISGTR
jgi:hypothetical protein